MMRCPRTPGLALVTALLVTVACGPDGHLVTVPDVEARFAANAEPGPDVVAAVVGGGGGPIFNGPGGPPFLGYVTVSVRKHADEIVDGRFGFDLQAPPGSALVAGRVEADCLLIDGNQAWISGPIVQGRGFAAGDVGKVAFLFVEDGGPGEDLIQFGNIAFVDPPVTDCSDRPMLGPPGEATGDYKISP